uniref:ATP synthase complex subunit 8 n=1 Tax=Janus sp. TaxID=3003420 RepID=A0A9E8YXI0_9HYME|nr:ATP synthase F0 subunit 8 [Janus sp.]
MPQMSPMNWMFLLIMFTLLLIMCISMIYFNYLPSPKKFKLNNKKTNFLNWKW